LKYHVHVVYLQGLNWGISRFSSSSYSGSHWCKNCEFKMLWSTKLPWLLSKTRANSVWQNPHDFY